MKIVYLTIARAVNHARITMLRDFTGFFKSRFRDSGPATRWKIVVPPLSPANPPISMATSKFSLRFAPCLDRGLPTQIMGSRLIQRFAPDCPRTATGGLTFTLITFIDFINTESRMPKIVENPEVNAVALASLVKLVWLLGGELVAGTHRDDVTLLEKCVREKLHASVNGISPEATAAGVALAHSLVEPILRALRVQAEKVACPREIPQATQIRLPSTLH